MIIDTHVHIYPPEVVRNWEKIAEREPHFAAGVRGKGRALCTGEDVLAEMAAEGIAEAWVCGFGFNDPGLCRACNEYAYEAVLSAGGRLKWLCAVPPMARGATDEIDRCAALGAIGVGEIYPDAQGWGMDECRETWRIAGSCYEHNMYLLVSAARNACPQDAFTFAHNHPELAIVMARLGGGLFLRESARDARDDLRNVYYDTSSVPFVYDSSIFEAGFSVAPNKIIFGSNFPDLGVARYREMLGETRLSDLDVDRLFHKNAQGLLSLAQGASGA